MSERSAIPAGAALEHHMPESRLRAGAGDVTALERDPSKEVGDEVLLTQCRPEVQILQAS